MKRSALALRLISYTSTDFKDATPDCRKKQENQKENHNLVFIKSRCCTCYDTELSNYIYSMKNCLSKKRQCLFKAKLFYCDTTRQKRSQQRRKSE